LNGSIRSNDPIALANANVLLSKDV
jgi:hypothetical protein